MQTIYKPQGRAGEYAPWALNIYQGCAHGCWYCYAAEMAVRFGRYKTKAEFHASPRPRPGLLEALPAAAKAHVAKGRADEPILLCFTTDPLQPIEGDFLSDGGLGHTKRAVEILTLAGCRVAILTKAGLGAATSVLSILSAPARHRAPHWVGISLTGADQKEEPGAAVVAHRLSVLEVARRWGVNTWVSFEPVVDMREALQQMRRVAEDRLARHIAVGKLNHRQPKHPINWSDLRFQAEQILQGAGYTEAGHNLPDAEGPTYYIKRDLREAAA